MKEAINEILTEYYNSLTELKPDQEEDEWNEDIDVFIIDLDERGKKKSQSIVKKNTNPNSTYIADKSAIFSNSLIEKNKNVLCNEPENMLLKNTTRSKTSNNPFSKSQQNQNQIFVLLEAIKSTINFYLKFYEVKNYKNIEKS